MFQKKYFRFHNPTSKMKKLTLPLLFFFTSISLFGQGEDLERFVPKKSELTKKATYQKAHTPYFFLGPGMGLYTYTGLLGGIIEVPIVPHFSVFTGFGIGGWGTKLGAGAMFYIRKDEYLGSAFGLGVSNAFGLDNFNTELSLVGSNGQTMPVTMNLNNASTLNLTYQYHIRLGNGSKFVVGTGYAVRLVDEPYEIISPQNAELDSDSKLAMQIVQPGGLIISLTFQFGVGKR